MSCHYKATSYDMHHVQAVHNNVYWLPAFLFHKYTLTYTLLLLPQLQSYATEENAGERFKGNVARACGENSFVFISVELSVVAGCGFIFFGLFLLLAIPVIIQRIRYLRELAKNSENYSFSSYGIFWGVSTTFFVCSITLMGFDLWFLIKVFHNLGVAMQVVWVLCIIILLLLTTAAALFIAIRSTFEVPHLYLFLARCCCCGHDECARKLVAFLALWFDMVALQMLCHHGIVAFLSIPAAPLIIITNVLLIVLLCTCLISTFAVVFTFCARLTNAYCNTDEVSEDDDRRSMLCAITLTLLLIAVGLFSALLASSVKFVNSATEQDSFLYFLLSIIINLILTGIVIGLQLFITKWLKTAFPKTLPAVEVLEKGKYEFHLHKIWSW